MRKSQVSYSIARKDEKEGYLLDAVSENEFKKMKNIVKLTNLI